MNVTARLLDPASRAMKGPVTLDVDQANFIEVGLLVAKLNAMSVETAGNLDGPQATLQAALIEFTDSRGTVVGSIRLVGTSAVGVTVGAESCGWFHITQAEEDLSELLWRLTNRGK